MEKFHQKIWWVASLSVARPILRSWYDSKSRVGWESFSEFPLAASIAAFENIFMLMSFSPGLCRRAISALFTFPTKPVPTKSYFEIGSTPVRPKTSRASVHTSVSNPVAPGRNRALCKIVLLLSSPASTFAGILLVLSRFRAILSVSFLWPFPFPPPKLLSSQINSVTEWLLMNSSDFSAKKEKSRLYSSTCAFVYVCFTFGILYGPLCSVSLPLSSEDDRSGSEASSVSTSSNRGSRSLGVSPPRPLLSFSENILFFQSLSDCTSRLKIHLFCSKSNNLYLRKVLLFHLPHPLR